MLLDSSGHAIPACDVLSDELTELGYDDPDCGEPESWPEWTDAFEWSTYEPTEEDWADYCMWSERFAYENHLPL